MMMRLFKDKVWLCVVSCIMAIISEGITVVCALLMGDAIDYATAGSLQKLGNLCIVLLGLTLLNNLIFIGSVSTNLNFAHKSTANIRYLLVRSLFRRDLKLYILQDNAYYINLLSTDLDRICNSYLAVISVEIKFLALFVTSVVAMSSIHIALFGVSILFAIIPMIVTWLFEKRIQKAITNCSKKNEAFQGALLQIIQGYETMKLNCRRVDDVLKQFNATNKGNAQANIKTDILQSCSYLIIDLINTVGQLALLGVGGYLIVVGHITAGELLSCTMLTGYVCMGVNNYLEQHMQRKAVGPIVSKVTREAAYDEATSSSQSGHNLQKGIQFDNVSFGFEEGINLFNNISLKFEPGKCYAIVGESGRGKTTLIRLLMKYYANYSGSILVYGRDLEEYSDREIFNMIGMLSQTESIFNASLYDNITMFGDYPPECSQEYKEVLEQVNLSSLAERVQDKPLGDFGDMLSGGERQRIALARLLVRKPSVFIFDEPMTGLGPENQTVVNDLIFSLAGSIRIVITHDHSESYLNRFDEVIRL